MADIEATILKQIRQVDHTIDIQAGDLTPIQQFYDNSHVFITGFTGFIGHILVEKLLRSCSVSTLYVLVRCKKGKSITERLEEIFENPIFQRVKKLDPNFRSKVAAVEGDCSLPGLGLSAHDKKVLIDKVEIVFHGAATVRFDEELQKAVTINVRGTRDILRLAARMSRLKSFVHVSTAYSNCVLDTIEEKIYPPAIACEQLIDMSEKLPASVLDKITTGIQGNYPNTYTFTKQVAEDVVRQEGSSLPIGIYKPSIVCSTYREPIRGWTNNKYGPTAVGVASGLGLLRVLYCDPKCKANIVPGDMCVNGLIAVAWDVANKFQKAEEDEPKYEIAVYTFESTNDKPISWQTLQECGEKYTRCTPSVNSVWYYSNFKMCKNFYQFVIFNFLLHTIPAAIADVVLFCIRNPIRFRPIFDRIYKMNMLISYFNTRDFRFISNNMKQLVREMTDRDKQIFFCDLVELDWEEFLQTYGLGARIYIMKEPLENIPEGKLRQNRLYYLHQATKVIIVILLLWILKAIVRLFC